MGVHNLWELLAPVGRRVSVETLAGKKLAIDASIWMVQFMKAMRDENGDMIRNAHLIGFFRRICKLLFLRTKPVFVFDGATPALKRRTVIARRRQRENAQTKIRKTAEKLLVNHLKAIKLKQLAEDIKNQRQESDAKGKKVLSEQTEVVGKNLETNDMVSASYTYNQEKLDEMLAASLAAEETGSLTGNASTSAAGISLEEEEEDDDEEMILPTMHGKVDPAVLAALPPSMQLDLLVQMRERLMAENRQKYQKVKKAPAKFSELQIQSYLKTVAFRREMNEVQKSAAGRGVGGVQTSRIASEASREFIFSTSFTGDTQALTSAGAEIADVNGNKQHQTQSECPSGSLESVAASATSSTAAGYIGDESERVPNDDVETYLDERGHVRVSRVRAMGLQMTRDLQRNLDMMKEIENVRSNADEITNSEVAVNKKDIGVPKSFPSKIHFSGTSNGGDNETSYINNRNMQSTSKNEASMEISFEDDVELKCSDGDDDLFARLVAGNPLIISSVENTSSRKQSSGSASDCDWEDGIAEDKVNNLTYDVRSEMKSSFVKVYTSDGSEVEWEEGNGDVPESASPSPAECAEAMSRGYQEEEADLQEAIRRSIEDSRGKVCNDILSENEDIKKPGEMAHEHEYPIPNLQLDSVVQQHEPICDTVAGVETQDGLSGTSISLIIDASRRQLASSITSNPHNLEAMVDKSCERYSDFCTVNSQQGRKELNMSSNKLIDASYEGGEITTTTIDNSCHVNRSCASDSMFIDMPNAILDDACKNDSEVHHETADLAVPFEGYSVEAPTGIDVERELAEERGCGNHSNEREHNLDNYTIKDKNKVQADITEASVEEEMLRLDQECINLGAEQRKNERNSESVSSEMFTECQELLQMFGLPYIIAPMEAEAQCAYMELANLVDGVVTDDSDVFLFGARSVYKNIFDDRKYVETYFMKDIESELGLTREKLVRMALLLGSDYTEGISGIGIVNAIEVVNAFPEEDGLHKFREWIESPDPNIFGKKGKRGSTVNGSDVSPLDGNLEGVTASEHNRVHDNEQSLDYDGNIKQIFMEKHRNVSKNWHIPSTFPSDAVISAYASPQVDKSTEPFSWGKPDLFVLRKLCWEKFSWSSEKADELLLPVLKEYNKHETQLRLEAFYTFNERFAKIRSKRINKALKGITGNKPSELKDDAVQNVCKTRKKRRASPIEPGVNKSENLLCGSEKDVAGNKSNSKEKPHKRSGEGSEKDVAGNKSNSKEKPHRRSGEGSSGNRRNRGRGRRQPVRRGRRKGSPIFESAESSSSEGNSSHNEQEIHLEKLEEPLEVRRSTRSRKPVNYIVNGVETDDVDKSFDHDNEESAGNQAVVDQELSQLQGLCGDAPVGPIDKSQNRSRNPLPDVGLCEDDLEIGGGFCMDEDETGEQISLSHNGDPLFEADYLKMGGGFCMDEGETDKVEDEHAKDPAVDTIPENTDSYRCSDSLDETEHDIHPFQPVPRPKPALNDYQDGVRIEASDTVQKLDFPVATNDVSNLDGPISENTNDLTTTTSVRALSAMPFLRRKRRKS